MRARLLPILLGLLAVGVVSLAAPAVRGAEPAAEEVARLIKQLGSPEFSEREAASRQLEQLGEKAVDALRDAAANSTDPEVRRRAERALESIRRRLGLGTEVRRFEGHSKPITCLAVSPDGKLLVAGSQDGTARLWEIASGKELQSLTGHARGVDGLAFSPDSRQVLSSGKDGVLRIWDVAAGKEARRFNVKASSPTLSHCAFSRDGKQFAMGGSREVIVWDITTGKESRRVQGSTGTMRAIAFSGDGKQLVTATSLGTKRLCVWDLATGKEVVSLATTPGIIYDMALSPDGKRIVTAHSTTKTLHLWDAGTLKEVRAMQAHPDYIYAVAISPDGKRALAAGGSIATSSVARQRDHTIRLWDLETGKELQRLEGHTNSVRALTFTPDGKHAVSAGYDHTARLWKLLK